MKILVMGAGAVGAYYGAQLQRAGEDVVFCARGENLRALREGGLEIKSFKGDLKLAVKATGDPREYAPYDLILFAVKSYDTESAARLLVQQGRRAEARTILAEIFAWFTEGFPTPDLQDARALLDQLT
jgi:ketopantoate reductase